MSLQGTIINALVANNRYGDRPYWHVSRVVFDSGRWWEITWVRGSTFSKKRARAEAREHGVELSSLEFQPAESPRPANLLERI